MIWYLHANAGQTISTVISSMSLGSLGLTAANIATLDNANLAMRHLDKVPNYVHSTRAKLGAPMSRFDSEVKNLLISSDNMSASRSRVIDANFAKG